MAKRRTRLRLVEAGGSYFSSPTTTLELIHSGSTVLDCVIGGGWPLGRVVNIVGDRSTGKTLLAVESLTNFVKKYPKSKAYYAESEAAFNQEYAQALGLPLDRIVFPEEIDTVEALYDNIRKVIADSDGTPTLYVLDSLDALSDESEKKRDIRAGSYGTGKAIMMSQLFRRLVRKVEKSQVCVMIISQVRTRIGITFGRNYTRSGGRALDFYASVILYLAHLGEIKRTVGGVSRTVGVKVKAKCTKNKVGLPFRECEFPIIFSYGIEDITASLDWLEANRQIEATGLSGKEFKMLRKRALNGRLGDDELKETRKALTKTVKQVWADVEQSFLPKRGKYS